jgi:hypothetical protein
MAKSNVLKGFTDALGGFFKKKPAELEQERQDQLRRDFEARQRATLTTPVAEDKPKDPDPTGSKFIQKREQLKSKAQEADQSRVESGNTAAEIMRGEMSVQQTTVEQARARNQALTQAAGQVGQLTPEQQQRQIILGEGAVDTAGALAKGAAGLGAGAAAGTFIAPGIGTAIGAGVGFVGGMFAAISIDQRQDVKQAYATAIKSNSNLAWIITEANSGRMNPNQAVEMFNEELSNLYSAHRNLKEFTKGKIGRELSGAMDERAKVQEIVNRLPYLQLTLQTAILNPNAAFVMDSRTLEDELNI